VCDIGWNLGASAAWPGAKHHPASVVGGSWAASPAHVTLEFKGKSECTEYMCARIKVHTCIDLVNTVSKRIKSIKTLLHDQMSQNCIKSEY
jgi:hypothetical protein